MKKCWKPILGLKNIAQEENIKNSYTHELVNRLSSLFNIIKNIIIDIELMSFFFYKNEMIFK